MSNTNNLANLANEINPTVIKAGEYSFLKSPLEEEAIEKLTVPLHGSGSSSSSKIAYINKALVGFSLQSKTVLKNGWSRVGDDTFFVPVANNKAVEDMGDNIPFVGVFYMTTTFHITRGKNPEGEFVYSFGPCPKEAYDAQFNRNDNILNNKDVSWRNHIWGEKESAMHEEFVHLGIDAPDGLTLMLNAEVVDNKPTFSLENTYEREPFRGKPIDRTWEMGFWINLSGLTAKELGSSPGYFREWRSQMAANLVAAGAPVGRNCEMFISGLVGVAYPFSNPNFLTPQGFQKQGLCIIPSAWRPYFRVLKPAVRELPKEQLSPYSAAARLLRQQEAKTLAIKAEVKAEAEVEAEVKAEVEYDPSVDDF